MSSKSFTTKQNQVDFDVDGEMFFLRPGIAAGQLFKASELQAKMQAAMGDLNTNAGKVLMDELEEIFEPDSFGRFSKRFWGRDPETDELAKLPIDIETFNDIITWIFGEGLGKGITPQ